METIDRKRGVFLNIILIILALDAISGFIYYLLVVTGYTQSVLAIPFWVNQLSLAWSLVDIILIIGIWKWLKWALIAEGVLLVAGFVFGMYLKIPTDQIIITPIIFSILLLLIRNKWKYLI